MPQLWQSTTRFLPISLILSSLLSMRAFILGLTIAIAAFPSVSSGKESLVTNPELDFVTSPLTADESYLPKSDEVHQLNLQLDAKSKPAIFLTYRSWGSRSGYAWVAYLPIRGGYRRVDGTTDEKYDICFREDGFYRAGPVPGYSCQNGLYVLYPGKGAGDLVHYSFVNGTVSRLPVRTIRYGSPKDMNFAARILGHWIGDRHDDVHNPSPTVLSATAIEAGNPSH